MSRTIKLISWNVNGVRAAYNKGFLDWLAKESPDILCVQETKAAVEQLSEDLLSPPGYRSYWHSAKKKGYSGVAVYTKTAPISVDCSIGIKRFDDEGRLIRVDYGGFVLFNVYFPNGKKDKERLDFKMDFYDAFLDCIDSVRREGRSVIFCGDVNTAHQEIDLARPKENEKASGFLPVERAWIDKVIQRGYVDAFRSLHPDRVAYSWWDLKSRARERNVGWRIDYIFVVQEMLSRVERAYILSDVMGSDHCPVAAELSID
jgi:exodeoxyribonuclease-3